MRVTRLQLLDFRSWPSVELELPPGPSTLIGRNGQGKTNILEGLGYLATLGSHRVAGDAPLIRAGAERAVLRASVVNNDRELLVELEIAAGKANRARVNRSPVRSPRNVLGILRTVLFAPEDLALVRGDPGERRRLLDDLLVARVPRWAGVRADYERVLRQRSALLKSAGGRRASRPAPSGDGAGGGSAELSTLEVWDGHLARHGSQLLAGRLDLVAELAPHVAAGYAAVAPESAPAELRYRPAGSGELPVEGWGLPGGPAADPEALEQVLLARLSAARAQELERGTCLVGPHRDELELLLGELPARGYASHGESWSLALALRLGSFELLRADGGDPVLLLDDVFAELDGRRRDRLAEHAGTAEQVLVTAAVPEDVPARLLGARFEVGDGVVRHVA